MNNYELSYYGVCPVDGAIIQYSLSVVTDSVIYVEHLETYVSTISHLIHEEQADKICSVFSGTQILEAIHGKTTIITKRSGV